MVLLSSQDFTLPITLSLDGNTKWVECVVLGQVCGKQVELSKCDDVFGGL